MNKINIFAPLTWEQTNTPADVAAKLKHIEQDEILTGIEINIPALFQLCEDNPDHVRELLGNTRKHINGMCGLASRGDTMPQAEKFTWFGRALAAGVSTVDMEYTSSFEQDIDALREVMLQHVSSFNISKHLVVEYANFEQTPPSAELLEIVEEIQSKGVFLTKCICMAQHENDNERILELLDARATRGNIVALCMGDIGLSSRISCVHHGSYATFGHLGEAAKTCPGQIYYADLHEKVMAQS